MDDRKTTNLRTIFLYLSFLRIEYIVIGRNQLAPIYQTSAKALGRASISLAIAHENSEGIEKAMEISIKNDALNDMNDSAANGVFLPFRYQVIHRS